MASALTLLLIGCLLQGALCVFKAFVPQTIWVLRGSCVTIPCSFDVDDNHDKNLDKTCKALWRNDQWTDVFDSSSPQSNTIKGSLTGNLEMKNCTTTLNNIEQNKYFLRVECSNPLKQNFNDQKVNILVNDNPPRPTLTPSTLTMKEGSSVSFKCSAPAPCPSHPPTLTWTPSLGDSQETMQEEQDKTKVKTSVLTFTASHLHHGQEISCTAVYSKEDGSTVSSVSSLTADISYSPKDTTVSVSPSGPVRENSTVTLTCNSIANPAVRSYIWYRADGGQETVVGTGQVLNITASKDSAPFYCKTENELGTGRSNITQIDVQYSPKDTTVSVSPSGPVPEDSIVTLTCNSIANPAVRSYTWYRADGVQETVVGTGRVLNITASKISAPFYCKTENGVGAGRSNISQIDVQYSPKDTTVSVNPSGPVPEDSIVTLTCNSTANPEVRSYTWYRANGSQETIVGTGQVLNIIASKVSARFICKTENKLGTGRSNISQIDVQFTPKILSSDCTKTADQLNCSCQTVGNPSPTLQWYLNGLPVNQSDKFAISNESRNDTGLSSILTVTQPQWRDISTLLCQSSNYLGSAGQRFYVYHHEHQSKDLLMLIFISATAALSVLVCALLLIIRCQKIHRNLPPSTVDMSQLLTSGQRNEEPSTTEEDIYANAKAPSQTDVANPPSNSEPNNATMPSSVKTEEGSEVIYSSVIWKKKRKKKEEEEEDAAHTDQPGSSHTEEVGGMCTSVVSNTLEKKEVECEYAQVKFKNKGTVHKQFFHELPHVTPMTVVTEAQTTK